MNSQAAQSLFTSKENNGKIALSVENLQKINEEQIIIESSQISETKDMDKDKRGSNPFSFYIKTDKNEEQDDNESVFNSINIFA